MTDLHHPRTAGEAVHGDNADLFPAAQPAQRVKPLVWEKSQTTDWRPQWHGGYGTCVTWMPNDTFRAFNAGTEHKMRADAIAAETAWHENYILSALQPAAQDGAEVERLRDALGEQERYLHEAEVMRTENAALKAEVERKDAEIARLTYVLDGVAGAIDTGRNDPLVIWREQINIARDALRAHEQGGA